ncbi:hypothetical protein Vqi01_40530 [Micromonospora qiuiae]|uniref:Transposase DDE domain-containing protein n=1 Tax=Micromonospora qiuiae TaxID=502268 RepID=A0ABQ4JF57_9ACTN|nr:hypothetical protein Vqi01_40530 [Micromonospora qiuiae]
MRITFTSLLNYTPQQASGSVMMADAGYVCPSFGRRFLACQGISSVHEIVLILNVAIAGLRHEGGGASAPGTSPVTGGAGRLDSARGVAVPHLHRADGGPGRLLRTSPQS